MAESPGGAGARVRSWLDAVRSRLGGSQGIVTTGVAFAVTVGAVAAIGAGFDQADLDILDPSAWLANDGPGSITHANLETAEADARIRFEGLQGHDLEVVQTGEGVYLLDRTTCVLYRIDTGNLDGADAEVRVPTGCDVDVVLAPGRTYVITRSEGSIQPNDPVTLDAAADAVHVERILTRGVLDDGDRLWVASNGSGDAVAVTGDREEQRIPVTERGRDVEMARAGGRPVVVDRTAGSAIRILPDGSTQTVPLGGPLSTSSPVQRESGDATVRIVDAGSGVLRRVDLDAQSVTETPLGRSGSGLGEPQHHAGRTYVPDNTQGDVVVVEEARNELADPIPVNPERKGTERNLGTDIEVRVQGDHAVINDPTGSEAVVVDRQGKWRKFDKVDRAVPGNERVPDQERPPAPPPPTPVQPAKRQEPSRPATTTTTTAAPGAPDAPSAVQATAGKASATVSWTAPDDNGDRIQRYHITAGPGGPTLEVGANTTQTTVNGLVNGTTYTVSVQAENSRGRSPAASSNAFTPESGIPDAPAGVDLDQPLKPAYDGKVKVSWGAPPDANGATVTGYEVTLADADTNRTLGTRTVSASATSADLEADPGTEVTATVAALYQGGSRPGPASPPTPAITVGGKPVIGDTSAPVTGDRQVTVNFTVDEQGAKTTCATVLAGTSKGGCTAQRFGGLGWSTQYPYRVTAENAFGAAQPVSGTSERTQAEPPPPRNPSISISKGGTVSRPDCSTSPCRWVNVSMKEFEPNRRYTVECWGSYGGWSPWYTYAATTDGNGNSSSSVCYFGYPGSQVRVHVDGKRSNTITW